MVAAPGLLSDDVSNGSGNLTRKVDHISFGTSAHPYSLSASGALRYKATLPGTATIMYHDVAQDGETSKPTKVTIFIEPTKPKAVGGCAGSASTNADSDHKHASGKTCVQTKLDYLRISGPVTCKQAEFVTVVATKPKTVPSSPGRYSAGRIDGLYYTCDIDPGYEEYADATDATLDCYGSKTVNSRQIDEIYLEEHQGA